jgi:hypothetical protein
LIQSGDRPVSRAAQLTDNPLETQLAGVPEDVFGIAVDVLIEADARAKQEFG